MYQIIVNPGARSGNGTKTWNQVKPILDSNNIEYNVYTTEKNGGTSKYVHDLYNEYMQNNQKLQLIVLGGDGTANEVVQGLPSFDKVSLSFIPTGTSNDLARALGISYNPEEAVSHLLKQPTTLYMDVGQLHCENSQSSNKSRDVQDRYFLVSSGIGYDAAICHEALDSKVKTFLNKIGLGPLTYGAICLKLLLKSQMVSAELTFDEAKEPVHYEKMLFFVGMNNMYEGGGYKFAPSASNHDGMIDICTLSGLSRSNIIKLMPYARDGQHVGHAGIEIKSVYRYTLKTSVPLWVHTDGEVKTQADTVTVSCLREALKVVY